MRSVGNALNTVQTNITDAQSYVTSVKTIYESDAMKVVREGVKSFADSLPGLLKALDEVAKLHPFIGSTYRCSDVRDFPMTILAFSIVVVGAFRVAVELDMKRRDNDKKIAVLFVEMRDMMEALLQWVHICVKSMPTCSCVSRLRSVKDEETIGPDGNTIKARMQELVKKTADDIKSCANA